MIFAPVFKNFKFSEVFSRSAFYNKLLLNVFITCALTLLSIYLPIIELTISLRGIFLISTGFIFGPIYGALNGFISDLFLFLVKQFSFSWLFLLQPIFMGFFGGISRILFENHKKSIILFGNNKNILVFLSVIFCLIFSVQFPIMTPFILVFPAIYFYFIYKSKSVFSFNLFNSLVKKFQTNQTLKNEFKYFDKEEEIRGKELIVCLSIAMLLSTFISSLFIGTFGASLFSGDYQNTNDLFPFSFKFFKVRVFKEIVKTITFIPLLLLYLKGFVNNDSRNVTDNWKIIWIKN